MKQTNKYKIHLSTSKQRVAQTTLEKLSEGSSKQFSVTTRKWAGKDKQRFYVRELVRQGGKG